MVTGHPLKWVNPILDRFKADPELVGHWMLERRTMMIHETKPNCFGERAFGPEWMLRDAKMP